MTAQQEAREILQHIRWQEARDGFIDWEQRKVALQSCIGLVNKFGDKRMKSLVMKAFNANNRMV